ncbi:glycosyltransferase [Thalassolituus pacificus]|uniref:Glycosyltransferase n=1 Tax=Thalassolituus pacificus TaxID=2975440 RepID=A0A9X3AS73_9GAMM|nr:glycosyltransferase [Thalassolituus pacificus]MCT7360095.1 glycosyltransferase [Thalassolituus pacificus]
MKLLVFSEAAAGGVLSVVSDQLRVLSDLVPDLEVDFVYCDRSETPSNIAQLLPPCCTVHNLGVVREDSFYLIKMYRKLKANFIGESYDAIHLHSSISGFVGKASYFKFRRKVFYTPHCYAFLAKDRGSFSRFSYLIVEAFLGRIGTVIACGDSEYMYAGLLMSRRKLVRNGVDFKDSSPNSKVVDIVSVGRICEQKGFDSFNRLMDLICHRYKCVWVGGPTVFEKERAYEITGWISRNEVNDILSKSRVYVSTAEWEGLPVAPIEAQAMGIPVVALDRPGIRDVVVHGVTGYLCKNVEEMALFLDNLLKDDDLYKRLSKHAISTALDRFSLDNYKNLVDIYRKAE